MTEVHRCRVALSSAMLLIALTVSAQGVEKESALPTLVPRTAGQIDLTGYWVSIVTQDWFYRMVTPEKGDRGSVPLNPNGLHVANEWNPAKEISASARCNAYGAAAIMRGPGRLHFYWENDNTLRLDLDAGTQTRLFHFAAFLPPAGFGTSEAPISLVRSQAPPGPATRQGYSIAAWQKIAQIRGLLIVGMNSTPSPTPDQGGTLVVMTTNMQPGYLQKNGIPYSSEAILTEYFDRIHLPNGADYLVITSIVEDPTYLTEPFVTSTQFKRELDSSRWTPTPCDPN